MNKKIPNPTIDPHNTDEKNVPQNIDPRIIVQWSIALRYFQKFGSRNVGITPLRSLRVVETMDDVYVQVKVAAQRNAKHVAIRSGIPIM
mmetsp:Transcript_22773/g.26228  ORF Transcript_22773/g.26228 Transcript_22773/m.26228 type:complete len:89 (+) Transcript_22773:365-631(+)